jgi:hypothetical protein
MLSPDSSFWMEVVVFLLHRDVPNLDTTCVLTWLFANQVPQIDRVVLVRIFIGKILAAVHQVNEAVLYKTRSGC